MDAENPEIYLCDACGYQTSVADHPDTASCSNCDSTMKRMYASDQLSIDGQTLDIEKVIDLKGLGKKAWQDRLKIDIRGKHVIIIPRKDKAVSCELNKNSEEDISDRSETRDLPAIDPNNLPKDDSVL